MSPIEPIRQIADAVLYEGYILWPYRRSATKNAKRWTFGGVFPRAHSEAHPDDPWVRQTQCLIEGVEPTLTVRPRFLQIVERRVAELRGDRLEEVDELVVGGERHLSWEEARERELVESGLALGALRKGRALAIDLPGGTETEEVLAPDGSVAGAIVREHEELRGTVELAAESLEPGLHRLTVRVANETPWAGGERDAVLRHSFCSTHVALSVEDGAFVSLTDPPPELAEAAEGCRNEGAWPVLVGEPGDRRTMLSAPIILEDYPRVAPESPGDFFDGGEIDQLLVLNILSLTDAEKEEMRASDPRAREILERTERMSPEELMRLHGAIRELEVVR